MAYCTNYQLFHVSVQKYQLRVSYLYSLSQPQILNKCLIFLYTNPTTLSTFILVFQHHPTQMDYLFVLL